MDLKNLHGMLTAFMQSDSGDVLYAELRQHDVLPWLERYAEALARQDNAICWATNCLFCAELWDRNYELYCRQSQAKAALDGETWPPDFDEQLFDTIDLSVSNSGEGAAAPVSESRRQTT